MKNFKVYWTENHDGDFIAQQKIFTAESEDAACDEWEKVVEPYVETSGIEDCVEVINHPLENTHLSFEMLDGKTYYVPVMFIAKHRADRGCLSLMEILNEFQSIEGLCLDYASQHIKWEDIQRHSFSRERNYKLEQFQEDWKKKPESGCSSRIL